jgi:hypothetical protein
MEGLWQIDTKELREQREQIRAERKEWLEINLQVSEFYREVDQIVNQCLESAGYHRHKRGEWRKKRTK